MQRLSFTPPPPAALTHRQQGAALITSLIILLVLTVLGVSAMSTSSLQELMSGNLRDQNLSFQAAETALKFSEQTIESWGGNEPVPTANGANNGVFIVNTFADGDFSTTAHTDSVWNQGKASPALAGVKQDPHFIIEHNAFVGGDASYASAIHQQGIVYYRSTSRGHGASTSAVTLLQETYGKRFR